MKIKKTTNLCHGLTWKQMWTPQARSTSECNSSKRRRLVRWGVCGLCFLWALFAITRLQDGLPECITTFEIPSPLALPEGVRIPEGDRCQAIADSHCHFKMLQPFLKNDATNLFFKRIHKMSANCRKNATLEYKGHINTKFPICILEVQTW